jgi:hypothetical protein
VKLTPYWFDHFDTRLLSAKAVEVQGKQAYHKSGAN